MVGQGKEAGEEVNCESFFAPYGPVSATQCTCLPCDCQIGRGKADSPADCRNKFLVCTCVAFPLIRLYNEKVVTQSEKRFLSRQIFSRLTSADASMPFVDRGNLKVSYDKETDEIILSEG